MNRSSAYLLLLSQTTSHLLATALLDGDPLKLVNSWDETILNDCSLVPFGNDLNDSDYPWEADVSVCRDQPKIATCFMARKLSEMETCSEAITTWKLCDFFPDAVTNFCCQSVVDNPIACPAGRAIVDGLRDSNGRVHVQAARPYLPVVKDEAAERRSLASTTIVDGGLNKSAVIIFPERLSLCTAAQSAWRIFRLAAMFLDLDSLAGMSSPGNLLDQEQFWPLINAAVAGEDIHRRSLSEEPDTNKTTQEKNTTRHPLTLPSPSLKETDTEKRFVDQWGPSEKWPLKTPSNSQRNLRAAKRRLAECPGIPQMINDVTSLATRYFGGDLEAAQFSQSLGELVDDNFLMINATRAEIPYKLAHTSTRYTGLVTPAFVMIPACQPTAGDLLKKLSTLDDSLVDVPEFLRLTNERALEFRDALEACGTCLEQLWAMIVMRANDEEGDPTEHLAAMSEGERIKQGLFEFHDNMSAYIRRTPNEELPQTVGDALQLTLAFAQEAAGEVAADSASILEAALLVLDVMQRELSEGGEMGMIQKSIAIFIKENLGCANKKGFQLDGDPDYPVDEESGGFWFRRRRKLQAEPRELARLRQQQQVRGMQIVDPGLIATEVVAPLPKVVVVEEEEEPAVALSGETHKLDSTSYMYLSSLGSGNLVSAQVPLTGYQCQDNAPGLYKDYLSLWLQRSDCAELIETFGCAVERPGGNRLLPLPVLLNACPATW